SRGVESCAESRVAVFFFQAEDGIRDWSVTGVQTCALPISPDGSVGAHDGGTILPDASPPDAAVRPALQVCASGATYTTIGAAIRSEERRVGKEWRARGAPGR